jgi:hypothetical protein
MELAIGTSGMDGLLCANFWGWGGWERHCFFLCVYRLCEMYCICIRGLAGIYIIGTINLVASNLLISDIGLVGGLLISIVYHCYMIFLVSLFVGERNCSLVEERIKSFEL